MGKPYSQNQRMEHAWVVPMHFLSPTEEVVPSVPWGRPEDFFTPAFWASIVATANSSHGYVSLDGNLRREVCFCLLGGFGIKAEINHAAYLWLSKAGTFD